MKQKIRIDFVDFWTNFQKTDNYFYHLLSQEFEVEISDQEPDILFHSVDYHNAQGHRRYDNDKTKKVFYTGENVRPNFNNTHFSFSFDYSDDARNYRLPLWMFHLNWFNVPHNEERDQAYLHPLEGFLSKKINIDQLRKEKENFCCFIASNPKGKRLEFVPKLHSYKPVTCGGRLFNNTGGAIKGRGDQSWKISFLNSFKFNISFENSSTPGYVTEKIIQPMFTNTVPIYWGSERVGEEFNSKSFLNYHDYNDDDAFIQKIKSIDQNEDEYLSMIQEPWFAGSIPEYARPESVLGFIKGTILK